MSRAIEIGPGIFIVAGPDLTDGRDALAYLVRADDEFALIDAGAGPSLGRIEKNIESAGAQPGALKYIIATHCHIDHIGGLAGMARKSSAPVAAHALDSAAIEKADPVRTAANWYDLPLDPVEVGLKIEGKSRTLELGDDRLVCLHTPGHTPGSMVVYLDRGGRRYLFGQDIHGPFSPSFGSDVARWRESMQILLDLRADVLAEGHYGVIEPAGEVARFIQGFLDRFKHKN